MIGYDLLSYQLSDTYSREELEMRYVTARLDYLRASIDPVARSTHLFTLLMLTSQSGFTAKDRARLRKKASEMYAFTPIGVTSGLS